MTDLHHVRSSLFVAVALWAVAGCGAPSPKKFVDGDTTKQLHPQAVKVVREEVEGHFGTPENLVASLYFESKIGDKDDKPRPVINFGRIDGEVIAAGEKEDYQIQVKLTSEEPLDEEAIQGLGLIWTSGAYRSAEEVPKKKATDATPKPANFRVNHFEGAADGDGVIWLNYKLEQPIAKGDKFILVGHKLRRGRGLYMQHCMHCHGFSGDANGPTAKYLNPRPRDYRDGVFKFTSTQAKDKASREDLYRIVRQGIPGTYMPSFLLLEQTELKEIIEYVRFLAVRGEYENSVAVALATDFTKEAWERAKATAEQRHKDTIKALREAGADISKTTRESFEPDQQLKKTVAGNFKTDTPIRIARVSNNWAKAETELALVVPEKPRTPATLASIQRGRALFLSTKTNCWECHGVSGRGNGPQTTTYLSKQFGDKKGFNPEPGLYDIWGNKLRPRNFHDGYFRGGRRPLDIYRRIKAGIKGTPMQAFGSLPPEKIWDLVNYVLSIPHLENGTFKAAKTPAKKPNKPQSASVRSVQRTGG